MSSLLIFGAGGHGKVVVEVAEQIGKWNTIVFVDDKYPELNTVGLFSVIAAISDGKRMQHDFTDACVAIGNNRIRYKLVNELLELGFKLPVIAHPSAYIAKSAIIEQASLIFANSVVQPDVKIGMASIINTAVTIDHDCVIGNAVHLSPGVHLGGEVFIGDYSWLGVGVSVINQISIGSNTIIGAGAAVVSDINSDVIAVGVPATEINSN